MNEIEHDLQVQVTNSRVAGLLDAKQMNVVMLIYLIEAKPIKPNGQRQCQETLRYQKKEF